MENIDEIKEGFEKSFADLRNLIDSSFYIMEKQPQYRDQIIDMWKESIQNFSTYAVQSSEKHNNRDVYKAISKALIFGK
ncbi:hypothetical protein HNQ80_003778 [Anaerosolibacter carboniphilus]|uniref:Uncharacterized protein n=1 Tax=Anaerosolibacter carboniphilus TaxID=1417629 RepID=A0A841L5R3_9FIRM|nr:hypothetical protein [Anaerosolibacter carboniphilus]MBB6217655.1 hypothetical protein [Anaerosolibacter carboniphilus]